MKRTRGKRRVGMNEKERGGEVMRKLEREKE